MFCPKCGKPDQVEESYCRQCGVWLPDLSKPQRREAPPEEHLRANIVLNAMTIVASFTMAVLLYAIMGFRPGTHPLVYVSAGMFLAIGGWHIQTLIRTVKLRRQLRRRKVTEPKRTDTLTPPNVGQITAASQPPASVTERTTRELHAVPRRSA